MPRLTSLPPLQDENLPCPFNIDSPHNANVHQSTQNKPTNKPRPCPHHLRTFQPGGCVLAGRPPTLRRSQARNHPSPSPPSPLRQDKQKNTHPILRRIRQAHALGGRLHPTIISPRIMAVVKHSLRHHQHDVSYISVTSISPPTRTAL